MNFYKSQIFFFSVSMAIFNVAYGKPTVCTLTMNSKNERTLFQKYLKPDYEFIELTKTYGPNGKTAAMNDERWFHKACHDPKLSCDIVLISGHFGGEFAGDDEGPTLKLSTIKEEAAQGTCPSVLDRPKEVYLFGCNTLAEKTDRNRDTRFTTYAQYYNHLLRDNYEEVDAKFMTDAKFLPIGFSVREQMQMIFSGNKIIYGFNDVAPLGSAVAGDLEKYLLARKNSGTLTEQSLLEQSEKIKNKVTGADYWGNEFVATLGKKSHADFGFAFSNEDKDGELFIEVRNLNWQFKSLPFKKNDAAQSNWEPLFKSVYKQMQSPFPREVAPEVLYFFKNQLAPYLKKHPMTKFMEDSLGVMKKDPLVQEFANQMKAITQGPGVKTNAYPDITKSVQILLKYLDQSEAANSSLP